MPMAMEDVDPVCVLKRLCFQGVGLRQSRCQMHPLGGIQQMREVCKIDTILTGD